MPAGPTEFKTIKAQKIAIQNAGGYVMWARIHYEDKVKEKKDSGWSGTYTNPFRHVVDMSEAAGITTGCKMFPEMAAMAGKWATGSELVYAPNGHTVVFMAFGSTSNPWLEMVD